MKAREILSLAGSIVAMLKLKGNGYELNRDLNKIRKILNTITEEIEEEVKLINDEISELRAEFCKKDEEGTPILSLAPTGETDKDGSPVMTEVYQGLARGVNPEYDSRIKKLRDTLNDLMKKEYEVNIDIKIPRKFCEKIFKNENFDGLHQGELEPYILDD